MKKIILALMMMVSFSFSSVPPIIKTQYGYLSNPVLGTSYPVSYASFGWTNDEITYPDLGVTQLSGDGGVGTSFEIRFNKYYITWPSNIGGTAVVATYMTLTTSKPPQCTASQELINNVCVEKCPSGQERLDGECVPPPTPTCDYGQGQYLNTSSNTCTDCSSFPTIAGRASCACDSQGSTYNDQSVTGTYIVTQGSTNYDRTDAKCTNGGYVPVFLNPRPVDSNPTTPPDTNGSGTGTGDTGGGTGGTGGGTGTGGTGGTTTPDTNTTTPTTPTTPTGTTNYADLITQLKANNQSVNDFKDKFTQFVTSDQANADRQYNATNAIKSAVDGTTSAVNTQGTAITNKLGDILNAIKDGNGTGGTGDGNNTNQIDLNATNKKLDTLHDDNNKTQGILDKIKGMFDNNDSFKVPDTNGSTPKVEDLIKDENWFNTNKMKLDFSYSGDCYCQTAQFEVGGRTFIFPPQELLDMIPFDVISKMLMAFVYLIGLRQFLRN